MHWFLPCCMECRRRLAMRILSICLSVKHVNCDKTEEKSVQIFIPYKRTFSLVFSEKEWLVGRPFLHEILRQRPPLERNRRFWTNNRSQCLNCNTQWKISINTNRKSTVRLPMSQRWLSYIAPNSTKGGSKPQKCRFPSKIALRLKKVCYKVLCVKTVGAKVVRHSLAVTNRTKMIGGGNPFYLKFWVRLSALEQNRRFSLVVPQQ